jgi:hypothetical protein
MLLREIYGRFVSFCSEKVSSSMVRKLLQFAGLALVFAATATIANAQSASGSSGAGAAPEIDASSMMSALTLLTGGVLMITDKFRSK